MIKSFRLQLTAWYLLFCGAALVLFSIFFYGLLSKELYQRLDDSLNAEAASAIGMYQGEFAESAGDARAAAQEVARAMAARGALAICEDERLLTATPQLDAGAIAAARQANVPSTISPATGSGVRVMARPFEIEGRHFVLVLAESAEGINADLRLVRRVLFIALPLVLLLVGGGGYWLATRSLAPVRRMAEQARTITDRNLRSGLDAGAASEELQTLADAFNELLARLDRSFAAMRRFVADASHELRTPLAVIRGETDVTLLAERSPEEYRESMAIIGDEARRLSRLVDDLLNLARADAESVKLHVEPFYMNDLLADCRRSVQPLAGAKNVAVDCRCSGDVTFTGDQELLRRLVLNLLDNAIRYTPPGGRVRMGLEAENGDVRIVISDTGIGISPEAAAHVFERFYRADHARSREQGGFGLGLSIVKWIAESHKGSVEMKSQPGEGSTFTVLLPQERFG